jgi:hypothetical protein
MRQKRNLKYHHDFKLRVSLQLQRGGLICRNLWSFSTLFVKLSTKSGEVHLCYYLRYLIIRSGSARTLQIQRTTKMLQTTIFASLFAVSLATVATSQVLSIDIDGDGAPDQLTAHSVNGGMTLSLCRSVGLPLSIQALPPASINDVRVLPPTDLDGDGLLDLVISIPTYQTGRVWILAGPRLPRERFRRQMRRTVFSPQCRARCNSVMPSDCSQVRVLGHRRACVFARSRQPKMANSFPE